LDEAGGTLWVYDMLAAVAARVELTPHDLEVYDKSRAVRWHTLINYFSINFSKAGFLRKTRGHWSLTPEGRAVLSLPAEEIFAKAVQAYGDWKALQPVAKPAEPPGDTATIETPSAVPESLALETAEAGARTGIERFVRAMSPYDFQDLIAALLRAMGYTIELVSAPGTDGGTDILAYPDPLGTKTPHIRVQVKHREDKARREEVAALRGIIRQNREIGLFVSSGGFTSGAVREARHGAVHIALMDWDGVLEKWLGHYERMPLKDRALLSLRPVYFLAPDRALSGR
jgi:restriction system protein